VAEEQGLKGVRYARRERLSARHAVVLDGSGPVGKAVTASPTQDNLHFYVRGRAAHAGVEPEKGVSAIFAAATAISRLELGRIDEETTANIGLMRGGIAVNIIPEQAWFDGEVRSHDLTKLEATRSRILKAVEETCREQGATVETEVERAYEGYALAEDDPLLKIAAAAAADLDIDFSRGPTGGGSDANVLHTFGIAPLVLSMGVHKPHALEEYIELSEMLKLTRFTAGILERAGSLS
jgi:tripeptide aminopeptidase